MAKAYSASPLNVYSGKSVCFIANTLSFGILVSNNRREMMTLATAKRPPSKSGSSNRKPSSSRSASHRPTTPAPSLSSFFMKFAKNPAGKALLYILGVLAIFGLDILLTLNNYDRFFVLLGIELILSVLVGWIIFVFKDRIKDRN